MKLFSCFFGLFFLVSASVSQGATADGIVPASLQKTIDHVKEMKQTGASRKDIAAYVNKTVMDRLTFLNHLSNRFSSDPQLEKKLEFFNTWRDKGNMVDDTFSAAVWAWENRMGQCNESASTAYHILVMALGSTDEITTAVVGDHRFVVYGDIKNLPCSFSADDLRKLDDAYIVDPWDGVSFSSKDLSALDWFQNGNGTQVARTNYRFYKRKNDRWLTWCKNNPVEYQKWLHGISDEQAATSCGRKLTYGEKRDQQKKIRNLINNSWRKKMDTAVWGVMSGSVDMIHVLRASTATTKYEGNLRIWEEKVNCTDACVQAVPNNLQIGKINKNQITKFQKCVEKCQEIKKMKCP